MARFELVLPALFLFALVLPAQRQPSTPTLQKTPTYAAIPVEAIKQPNPVKSSPESLARAKKWWTLDCAMCPGADHGNGKGETAKEMKLTLVDFTHPAALKDRTDGEIFYIIKNGHNDMPPEGPGIKTEENCDLVNYARSLANKQPAAEPKPWLSAKRKSCHPERNCGFATAQPPRSRSFPTSQSSLRNVKAFSPRIIKTTSPYPGSW